jgi:carboxypeptidase Q
MLKKFFTITALLISLSGFSQSASGDSVFIRKIYDMALTNSSAYTNLYTLCKNAPARLSGSENAAKAVDITLGMLKQVSDTAWLQETMVPH